MDKEDINGWQNAYVHNARYALLIGGGGSGVKENYPAFSNDLKAMYDKLYHDYSYERNDIHSYLWNVDNGTNYWSNGYAEYSNVTFSFESIRAKITSNDLFIFVEICHGGDTSTRDDAYFSLYRGHMRLGNEDIQSALKDEISNGIKKCSRMVFIFQSCQASYGIRHLSFSNSIVICSENHRVDPFVSNEFGAGNSWTEIGGRDHWSFIYQGIEKHWYAIEATEYPGFILSIGNQQSPQSILYAFNNGYLAASNNWFDRWPFEDVDGRSHPMLEDNPINGIDGTQGPLMPNSGEDGEMSKRTYI